MLYTAGSIGDISQPMTLTTYVAVADFVSPDGVTPVFSFKKGSLLQVVQKDQSGTDHDEVFHGLVCIQAGTSFSGVKLAIDDTATPP